MTEPDEEPRAGRPLAAVLNSAGVEKQLAPFMERTAREVFYNPAVMRMVADVNRQFLTKPGWLELAAQVAPSREQQAMIVRAFAPSTEQLVRQVERFTMGLQYQSAFHDLFTQLDLQVWAVVPEVDFGQVGALASRLASNPGVQAVVEEHPEIVTTGAVGEAVKWRRFDLAVVLLGVMLYGYAAVVAVMKDERMVAPVAVIGGCLALAMQLILEYTKENDD